MHADDPQRSASVRAGAAERGRGRLGGGTAERARRRAGGGVGQRSRPEAALQTAPGAPGAHRGPRDGVMLRAQRRHAAAARRCVKLPRCVPCSFSPTKCVVPHNSKPVFDLSLQVLQKWLHCKYASLCHRIGSRYRKFSDNILGITSWAFLVPSDMQELDTKECLGTEKQNETPQKQVILASLTGCSLGWNVQSYSRSR